MKNRVITPVLLALLIAIEAGYAQDVDAELIEAAKTGQVEKVRRLIGAGADVNAMDEEGRPVLGIAALHGQTGTVKALLDAGADAKAETPKGNTPLMGAAANGRTDIVEILIDAGANVNARNKEGKTPLRWAVGRIEAMKVLLREGAEVEAEPPDGSTALFSAAGIGQADAVKLLIDAGANVNARNKNRHTALMKAAYRGNTDHAERMLRQRMTFSLSWPASTRHADAVRLLIDAGADVNAKTKDGHTALMWAASQGQTAAVRLLLDAGAGLDHKLVWDGRTALLRAASGNHPKTVKLLIDAGADVNAKRKEGFTALMMMAGEGHTEIVRALIEAGADVNAKTDGGDTALSLMAKAPPSVAAKKSHTDIIRLLEKAGGKSPGVSASRERSLEVLRGSAAEGDANAQFALGNLLERGDGVPPHPEEAAQWYEKAAQQGHAESQYTLGIIYLQGQAVEKDYAAAARWFRKAAQQGVAPAQFNLGWMYTKGQGVPRDDVQGHMWVSLAASRLGENKEQAVKARDLLEGRMSRIKIAEAQQLADEWKPLGKASSNRAGTAPTPSSQKGVDYRTTDRVLGTGVLENTKPSLSEEAISRVTFIRGYAERGDATSQYNLGRAYQRGYGVLKDDEEAVWWFRKAAEQGHSWAQFGVGLAYVDGQGVPRDDQQAVRWFREAAEQGHVVAQSNLGMLLHEGRGVLRDHEEAVQWLRKAAERGFAPAQNLLSTMYRRGKGVHQDNEEAIRWLRKAADQGNAAAITDLGSSYARGQGVPRDVHKAAKLYQKAADLGFGGAQLSLAFCYLHGTGVWRDYIQAHIWATLSEARLPEEHLDRARRARELAAENMTPEEISQAQKLAAEWTPKSESLRSEEKRVAMAANPSDETVTRPAGPSVRSDPNAVPRIVFLSSRDGEPEIHGIDPDGSNLKNLTNHPSSDHSPAWSPDGKRIAFVRFRDLYVMNADGSNQILLAKNTYNDPQLDFTPAWSPDGSRIAFQAAGKGYKYENLFVIGADGANLTNLTNSSGGTLYQCPSWSPDGLTIVFQEIKPGTSDKHSVVLINVDGSDARVLVEADGIRPAWSPDGRKIAYGDISESGFTISLIAANGSDRQRLVPQSHRRSKSPKAVKGSASNLLGSAMLPSWSPDGARIAFKGSGPLSSGEELWIMDADGSNPTRLAEHLVFDMQQNQPLSWSPDGSSIVFTGTSTKKEENYDIFVAKVDGSGIKRLTTHTSQDSDPVWSPVN